MRPLTKSRTMALAAAIAVSAATIVITTTAAGPGDGDALVPIVPCRLMDTRPDYLVGTRDTPLGADSDYTATVWGSHGECDIPTSATGVSLNVTAVGPTEASFLTLFPSDSSRPTASSLNYVAGQAPTPNAVTVKLSATGTIKLYNYDGTVDVIVDIVGYYAQPLAPDSHVIVVATSGGDFTSLSAAMNSITGSSPSNQYLIRIAPGIYSEDAPVVVRDHVDITGAGESVTTIECDCGGPSESTAGVLVADGVHATISGLTVVNYGGGVASSGVVVTNVTGRNVVLHDLTAMATNGTTLVYGVLIADASPVLDRVTASANGGAAYATGISITNGNVQLRQVVSDAASSTEAVGIAASASYLDVQDSDVTATAAPDSTGMSVVSGSVLLLNGARVSASGTVATGVDVDASEARIDALQVSAIGSTSGVALAVGASTVEVLNSQITGNNSLSADAATVRIANSRLGGGVSGSTLTCTYVVDVATLAARSASCA